MRVMVLVKATEDSEKGFLPTTETTEMMEAMGRFNEELVNAGIMPAGGGDGLKPSSYGKRIAFDGPGRTVIDGPFAETRELVAGFWLWEVKDMDEAVAWVKRCPNPMPGPSEIANENLTPDARVAQRRLRLSAAACPPPLAGCAALSGSRPVARSRLGKGGFSLGLLHSRRSASGPLANLFQCPSQGASNCATGCCTIACPQETSCRRPAYQPLEEVITRYRGQVSEGTPRNWRTMRIGPAFVEIGKAVLYPVAELDAWDRKNIVACYASRSRPMDERDGA